MNEAVNENEQVMEVQNVSDELLKEYKVKEKELILVNQTIFRDKTVMANLLGGFIIGGFLFCVILILFASIIFKCITSAEASDLLKTISTIFGTSLGFVLGFFYGVNQKN